MINVSSFTPNFQFTQFIDGQRLSILIGTQFECKNVRTTEWPVHTEISSVRILTPSRELVASRTVRFGDISKTPPPESKEPWKMTTVQMLTTRGLPRQSYILELSLGFCVVYLLLGYSYFVSTCILNLDGRQFPLTIIPSKENPCGRGQTSYELLLR